MTSISENLESLRSAGLPKSGSIPRPKHRWKRRVIAPTLILGSAGSLLAISAADALTPKAPVWVVPVIPMAMGAEPPASGYSGDRPANNRAVTVQAPGWIEPDPYPINIAALAEGVVREILVMEGDAVQKGQLVVRMYDDDARLNLQLQRADLEIAQSEKTRAEAEVQALELQRAGVADRLERAQRLSSMGAGADADRAQLDHQARSLAQSVAAAMANVEVAEARINRHEQACRQAELMLSRMEISAPASGIVLSRFVEPGVRVSLDGPGGAIEHAPKGIVIRLYDPSRLQVRVDVPLADIAPIQVGATVEITSDALPNRVFRGRVSRILQEGNIQKNTIQLKVSLSDPDPVLRPEMLVRVRIAGVAAEDHDASPTHEDGSSGPRSFRVLLPDHVLSRREESKARVWAVVHDRNADSTVATARSVTLQRADVAGYVEVTEGLQPGDRVIAPPHENLRDGSHVRIMGEAADSGSTGEVSP